MQGKCVWLAFFAACLELVSATAAAAQDDFARNGFYLGVAGSVGIYTELQNELENQFFGDADADVDPAPGVFAQAGYRFHPNFAGDVSFEWISTANISGDFVSSDAQVDRTLVGMANLKGYMLTGRVQPFGAVGLGYMNTRVEGLGQSEDEGRFAARLGGGVDLYLTEHILGTVGASYVIPDDDLHDFAYVSVILGLGYRF